jgi:DNA topoisomerase-1
VGTDPETGLTIIARNGRFGPYVQLGTAEEVDGKPKTASLFQFMTPASVTLDEALQLLSLPRVLGVDAAGEEIEALNGRYGPYLKAGKETRSLPNEESLFTVTLDEALALLAQPKTRGRRAPAAPLREIGVDPGSGQPVVVRQGRFGPYVTDGETNASLRTGDDVTTISIERAAELLQDRRDRGPSKRPAKKKATAKKAAAKKTTKKSPAKKATAKKTAARKSPAAAKASATKAAAAKSDAATLSADPPPYGEADPFAPTP